ncbi:MAG TPA: ATP-binding cassette domain-containing protein [Candidatus Dormibacteraeota bacterium]
MRRSANTGSRRLADTPPGTLGVGDANLDALPSDELVPRRKVGCVFQWSTALRALTPAVNATVPRRGYPARKVLQRRAHQLLEQVGLRGPGSFDCAAGDQQRVAIARAIIVDPPLLLADEPTGISSLRPARRSSIPHRVEPPHRRDAAGRNPRPVGARCVAPCDGRGRWCPPTATAARDSFARP